MDPNDRGTAAPHPTTGNLSHRFIEALAPARDRLYAQALAHTVSPAAAESALQSTARKIFHDFSADPHLNVPAQLLVALAPSEGTVTDEPEIKNQKSDIENPLPPSPDPPAMPADAWARLAAAVQFEAASSSQAGALHPDSVLLQPDPLLAPKKTGARTDDTPFDVASPSRLITLLAVVLLAALLITLYILTRPPHPPAPPHDPPATTPAGAP